MGVFKEEAHAFETIARNSRQIFTDAADLGVPFNYKNPSPEVQAVFRAIQIMTDLDKSYPEEKPLIRNRQTWKGGVSVDAIIFWERDEGYYRGTKYHICFSHIPRTASQIEPEYDAMISVDVEPYMEKS